MIGLLLTWYCLPHGLLFLLPCVFPHIPATMHIRISLSMAMACLLMHAAQANNIQVSNTQFTANTETTATIRFDLTWENSWRGNGVANWDAAWMFVKYKQNNGVWRHALLAPEGHTAPSGSMIDPGLRAPASVYHAIQNPVVGVFIRRDADGSGTFTANGVQLFWDHGAQGVAATSYIMEVRVFAIEMVYVNEGPFWLGDESGNGATFQTGSTTAPYPVYSEAAIPMNNTTGLWAGPAGGSPAGFIQAGTLPAAFPKGYRAFYCMKYELTQQQYVDFLNCLTRLQQSARVYANIAPGETSPSWRYVMTYAANTFNTNWRNAVCCDATIDPQAPVHFYCDANGNSVGGEADDGQWIVGNYVSQHDLASYLDWSGLRPMTELEYEKACRGPLLPVPNEYAWGNAQMAQFTEYVLGDPCTAHEGVVSGYSTTAGNAWRSPYEQIIPKVGRVGTFAANPANTGRMTSGAGFYGIMDLTGNVRETTVGVGRPDGRTYTGAHGDGELTTAGRFDVTGWPTEEHIDLVGFYRRGDEQNPPVSRRLSYPNHATARSMVTGGRGVRTTP